MVNTNSKLISPPLQLDLVSSPHHRHMHASQFFIYTSSLLVCLSVVLMNGRFRCGVEPCQCSFDSGWAIGIHHSSCAHYQAYVSHPWPKWPNPQISSPISKRARQELEVLPTPQTVDLDTPSPLHPARDNHCAAEVLSEAVSLSSSSHSLDPVMGLGTPC